MNSSRAQVCVCAHVCLCMVVHAVVCGCSVYVCKLNVCMAAYVMCLSGKAMCCVHACADGPCICTQLCTRPSPTCSQACWHCLGRKKMRLLVLGPKLGGGPTSFPFPQSPMATPVVKDPGPPHWHSTPYDPHLSPGSLLPP